MSAMGIKRLAAQNFRKSFSSCLSLILSLAFTVMIIYNFQNIIYTETFTGLQGWNKTYIDTVVRVISVVLLVFLLFFVWYATNVFLTRRKKEIGIYVFMGLSNQRIAKLYAYEMLLIGITALLLGLGCGCLLSQLFQMILLAMSDISVDFQFRLAPEPMLFTGAVYGAVYVLFTLKGYLNIVRSSVLSMISANRRNEYVRENRLILLAKAVLGLGILFTGFFLAVKDGGMEVMGNLMGAVVLVIIGVYLLFGGFLPLLFQGIVSRKEALYLGERTLWINNVVYRMRKNHRAYAMTCVLMLCSVTALAAGFAMKNRYENRVRFRNTYTFQILSDRPDLRAQLEELIGQDAEIACETYAEMLSLYTDVVETEFTYANYGVLRYSQVAQLAEEAGLEPLLREPGEEEVIALEHLPLLSFITNDEGRTYRIGGREVRQIDRTDVPYLGYLQESYSYFVVNDGFYEELRPMGSEACVYNFTIADPQKFTSSRDRLDPLILSEREEGRMIGRVAIDPEDDEEAWIRVLYSLCIFVFLVFVAASGSILFMKLYNDAFEERERYRVLKKIGCSEKRLRRAVARELGCAYLMPFAVMAGSAFFSVHAMEKLMSTGLMPVYGVSVLIVLLFFLAFYLMSVRFYYKNAEL